MKRWLLPGALFGLSVLAIFLAQDDLAEIGRIVAHAGWPLLWLVPIHLLALWCDVRGWRLLLEAAAPGHAAKTGFLLWVATIREAVSRLLPTAGVGGELVGIHLAQRRAADGAAVTSSVVVEVMVTMFAHYLFALTGVLLLLSTLGDAGTGALTVAGLLLSLPVPVLFAYALRRGAWFARLQALAQRMLGEDHRIAAMIDGERLDARIRALCRDHRLLVRTLAWQLGGLMVGTLEVWWTLSQLGHPVGFGTALAIEALTLAARQMAFFVPAGMGVQEAVIVLLATHCGIDVPTALALALVKRGRELLFGVPALLSWQWVAWRDTRSRPTRAA